MAPFPPVHVLAVYSPNPRTSRFLKQALDSAGFAAFAAPLDVDALEGFVDAIRPAAIVFDFAATTSEHWEHLVELCQRPPVGDIPMVITLGGAQTVSFSDVSDRLVLAPVVELFNHMNDLRELRAAVHQVLRGGDRERWRQSAAARRAS